MPYCTLPDLITAFGVSELIQLSDRQGAGVVDESILDAAIAAADAEINQRLRAKGWPLPLAMPSADLMRLSRDMARFYLHANAVPDPVQAAFD